MKQHVMDTAIAVTFVTTRLTYRPTWRHTSGSIQASGHIRATYARRDSQPGSHWRTTCALTRVSAHINVTGAPRASGKSQHWQTTCASTRVSGHTSATYVVKVSRKRPHWQVTWRPTLATGHINVLCVLRLLFRAATSELTCFSIITKIRASWWFVMVEKQCTTMRQRKEGTKVVLNLQLTSLEKKVLAYKARHKAWAYADCQGCARVSA